MKYAVANEIACAMKYAVAYEGFILFHIEQSEMFHNPSGLFHIFRKKNISLNFQLFLVVKTGSEPIVHLVRFALAEHDGHIIGEICEAMFHLKFALHFSVQRNVRLVC